jgi:hypothetical protein
MIGDEMDEAVFDSYPAAKAAADAAMPRRKHNRPRQVSSGWHWARSVLCPTCSAEPDRECVGGRLHPEREAFVRTLPHSVTDRWIVMAPTNIVMLADGSMFDFARKVTVRK